MIPRPYTTRAAQLAFVVIAVAALTLALRGEVRLFDKPLTEDGYYSLAIAKNIADGLGVTYDGVHLTNGFQPLFTFVTVPIFRLFSDAPVAAIRTLLALHWLVFLATALLVGRIVAGSTARGDRRLATAVGTLAYASAAVAFWHHFNGLETGFLLFMYALAWRVYQRRGCDTPARAATFGALLGLLILTRIDASFFVAFFCLYLLLRPGVPRGAALVQAIAAGLGATLVASPWFIYNVSVFGSFMPTSGSAQQEILLSMARVRMALGGFFQPLVPWVYESKYQFWWVTAGRAAIATALAVALWRRRASLLATDDPARAAEQRRSAAFGKVLLATFVALAVWYTITSWAVHFYFRYLAPVALCGIVAAAVLAVELAGRWPRALAALCAVAPLPMLGVVAFVHGSRGYTGNNEYREQLALVTRHVPPGAAVAASQSGTLGFFRRGVINVDGKVNHDALRYRGHMDDYLRAMKVDWFCDWPRFAVKYFGADPETLGWRAVASMELHTLYRRVTPAR